MRKRTRSREFALQILYQLEINRIDPSAVLEDFWRKVGLEDGKENDPTRQYTERLVNGVLKNIGAIDEILERFAENWTLRRMAYIDRNILRLSAYEMIYMEEIPMKVAINEAVELAKRYGEPDSSKFVNGILDKIAKSESKK